MVYIFNYWLFLLVLFDALDYLIFRFSCNFSFFNFLILTIHWTITISLTITIHLTRTIPFTILIAFFCTSLWHAFITRGVVGYLYTPLVKLLTAFGPVSSLYHYLVLLGWSSLLTLRIWPPIAFI